ncbi:MAG: GIY-YIG nuclease family protein [Candidatus Margulisiibacteriota bacterium]
MTNKTGYVYILTNAHNKVLYTGVTSNLKRRILEHKEKTRKGFTQKYNVDRLVYYECFDDVRSAIKREKQIKGGARFKKIQLINAFNKEWRDLYDYL